MMKRFLISMILFAALLAPPFAAQRVSSVRAANGQPPLPANAPRYTVTELGTLGLGPRSGGGGAPLAAFTVDSATDAVDAAPGDGVCATALSVCTLRAAIQESNALAGDDTIILSTGTYTLTLAGAGEDAAASGDLDLTSHITLDGAGAATTIIDANFVDRVFHVTGAFTVNLSGVTITHGTAPGSGNSGSGAGVYNSGTLNVTNVTFSDNSASYGGGGIHSTGTLNVTNSAFSGNSGGYGGGITIFNGTSAVTNSAFSGNSGGYGGGIANWNGTSTVMNSAFSGNSGIFGGGIANWYGCTLNVTNSTFSGNTAVNTGGGIYNSTGTVTVTNSTLSGNSVSGGSGGGIYNATGTVTVTNSTFSGNSATSGSGIHNDTGGTMNLKNGIVANAPAGGNCFGTITDGGGNLQFGGTLANSCGATIPTADPVLGALADNGGPTRTMALGPGSAALDGANYATCMAAVGAPDYGAGGLDQRGQSRADPSSVCDIGAFEGEMEMPQAQFNAANYSAYEDSLSAAITVTLVPAPVFTATVDYAAAGGTAAAGSDYTPVTGTLTFTPGVTLQTFSVPILNDTLDEAGETISLTLSSATNAIIAPPNPVALTILDDDPPPVVTFDMAAQSVLENAGVVTLTVFLDTASGQEVSVPFTVGGTATGGGVDYNLEDVVFVIPAGETQAVLAFPVFDDLIIESDETILVTLSIPINAVLGSPSVQTITLHNVYWLFLPLMSR